MTEGSNSSDSSSNIEYFRIGVQVGSPAPELATYSAIREMNWLFNQQYNLIELEDILLRIVRIASAIDADEPRTELLWELFQAIELIEDLRRDLLQLEREQLEWG